MYPVTARFLRALTEAHTIDTTATYEVPGGAEVPLRIVRDAQATVTLDTASRARRRASLSVYSDRDTFDALTTPGCIVRVLHGIRYSSANTELVPVFAGELQRGERPRGRTAGRVALPLWDMWGRVARAGFVEPFAVAPGTTRAAAIAAAVVYAWPTVVVDDRSGGAGGSISSAKVWLGGPAEVVADLATDGNLVCYFDGAGTFVIERRPTSTAQAVWSVQKLTEFADVRPLDRLYNMVKVKPSASDGSQTWDPQVVQVSDPDHPRHPDKIGPVLYEWASPTADSAGAAFSAAQSILYRLLGSTESLELGTLSNPALEGLDVIRITSPRLNSEPADTFSHFVDGFNLNLATGGMTIATRKQVTDG